MNTILHLSDFHINATMPSPENNEVFRDMIIKVKEQNLENLIIVYTGDIIDNEYITIPDGLSEYEKKIAWEQGATEAFSKAASYFKYLTRELHIDNNHIIIALGNHDVNQHDVESASFNCPIEKIQNIEYGKDRFDCITKFIEDINYQYFASDNHFRKIDCFNFIVANTQWVDKHNPKTKLLCLNCNSLNAVFNQYERVLTDTKNSLGKMYNIFVAHNPERDCCEYSCFEWPENDYTCLEKKVVEFCGIKLFGDKHTNSIYKHDYIVGAPLNSDSIFYGIHSFNNNNYTHKILSYSKDKNWCVREIPESIKKILNLSFDYLKPLAFHYLNIDYDINSTVKKVFDFHKVKMEDSWNNLDGLFSSIVKLKEPVDGQPGNDIDFHRGVFDCVTKIIRRSHNLCCLTIRGSAETGKSTFLSSLYLNLLYEYSIGLFPYIPVYINIEKIIHLHIDEKLRESPMVMDDFCIDNIAFFDEMVQKIDTFFETLLDESTNLNTQFSIIVDGVKQFKYYDNFDLENHIYAKLLNYKEKSKLQTSVICIDTDKSLNLEVTLFDQKKDSEYIAYFDSIYSYNVKSRQRLERFVRSYCLLNNYSNGSEHLVLKSIEDLGIPWVDLNLLTIAGGKLVSQTREPVFNILYDYYKPLVFSGTGDSVRNLPMVSYLLYFENLNYTAIKQKESQLGYKLFNKITRQGMLSKMLIAICYCNQIIKQCDVGKSNRLSNTSKKVLNRLYNYELCSFITGNLKYNNSGGRLKSFEKKYYKFLGSSGKSTLTYLIGRIIDNKNELKQILKDEEEVLKKENITRNEESLAYYEYRLAKRSIYISRIANDIERFLSAGNYFDRLLEDDYERRINRKFYLQFYGDRNELQIEPQHDVILYGLDFYYTYQLLASRLNEWRLNGKKSKVLDLELVTLCDLIQVHLDIPKVTHRVDGRKIIPYSRSENKPSSFFYNSRYTDPNRNSAISLLKLMIDIIDNYNKQVNSRHRKYKQYLHVRQNEFENALGAINKKMDITTFKSNSLLDELSKLAQVKRIGWHIDDSTLSINDNMLKDIRENPNYFETTLEHVYECLLIGLFYLPESVPDNDNYDKTKILKMLLIHDMGEAYIGDYPPSYIHYERTRVEEDKINVRTFLSGTHEGIADLTEYLNLWNGWYKLKNGTEKDNINIRIAAEIDKIQMIYKLFSFLTQNSISLPSDRVNELYDSRSKISTTVGIKIFNELIANNSEFQKEAKNRDISLNEI